MDDSTDTSIRTILHFPDGTERELTPTTTDIRIFKVPGDPAPRFEIDGQRYAISSVTEFPFLPMTGGRTRLVELVALGPPAN